MSVLRIEECFITQQGLRNVSQLKSMVEFVKGGGHFNKDGLKAPGPLIHIVRFEDGQLYIQDGHHRMCAMVLADRPFLWGDEYVVEDWEYQDYKDVNSDVGWLTPYDPRIEVRYPDYSDYKHEVQSYLNKKGKSVAIEYINHHSHLYSCQRNFYHIRALIDRMDLEELSLKVKIPSTIE